MHNACTGERNTIKGNVSRDKTDAACGSPVSVDRWNTGAIFLTCQRLRLVYSRKRRTKATSRLLALPAMAVILAICNSNVEISAFGQEAPRHPSFGHELQF